MVAFPLRLTLGAFHKSYFKAGFVIAMRAVRLKSGSDLLSSGPYRPLAYNVLIGWRGTAGQEGMRSTRFAAGDPCVAATSVFYF